MLYTPLTKRALRICMEAHAGQTDRAGIPYANHPLHVAESMTTENATCVALLHDVCEDTDWTFDALVGEGFPPEVVDALELLSHKPDVDYLDYVRELRGNDLAREVKIADLRHNSQLARLDEVGPDDLDRLRRYREARVILGDLQTKIEAPFGTIQLMVDDVPHAFSMRDMTQEAGHVCEATGTYDWPDRCFELEADVLTLEVGDVLRAKCSWLGELEGFGSEESCVWFVESIDGWSFALGATCDWEDEKDWRAAYHYDDDAHAIVEDPVPHRFVHKEHTVRYVVSWKHGTDEAAQEVASWPAGLPFE